MQKRKNLNALCAELCVLVIQKIKNKSIAQIEIPPVLMGDCLINLFANYSGS